VHPLQAVHQFYQVTFAGFFVAIGDVGQLADNWEVVIASHGFARGQPRPNVQVELPV